MTASEFMRQVVAEFAACGWNAVLHGPEAHLVLPHIVGLILMVAAIIITRREKRDKH